MQLSFLKGSPFKPKQKGPHQGLASGSVGVVHQWNAPEKDSPGFGYIQMPQVRRNQVKYMSSKHRHGNDPLGMTSFLQAFDVATNTLFKDHLKQS